ncbi:MAG: hypothetical protein LBP50_04615, partial [Tannerella sp.]|nr:hypothetical protein [Tannerella sp.]
MKIKLWHAKSKAIIWPHLNDCVTHPQTRKKVRTRVYNGFESFKTKAERYKYTEKLIEEYNRTLKSGWRSFDSPETKQYVDELKYHAEAKMTGHKSVTKSYILLLLSEYLIWKRPTVKHSSFLDYQLALRQFSLDI